MKKKVLAAAIIAALSDAGLAQSGEQAMAEVTVTGTREGQAIAETAATVDVVKEKEIRETRPTHPSQVMGRIPGVWVTQTSGEGHVTSIRQPLTTGAVYLYLEDGIPTRSTGFFNHNAMFEVNVPMSGGIEVSKGPGTSLYGSDAIGGTINVLTRKPPAKPEFEVGGDVGPWGWRRLLVSGGSSFGDDAVRADVNVTTTDGWRNKTAYDRQAATVRWDRAIGGDALLKVVMAYSKVDQETAGRSTLSLADYENNPTKNTAPISFRKVDSFRLSANYEKEAGDTLVSITPYYRRNGHELMANWALGYDPSISDTTSDSYGVLLKWRRDFAPMKARLIAGVDIDHTPGKRKEDRIQPNSVGGIYTSYAILGRVYEYDVAFSGISPYLHGEASPTDRLRLTAGLRYDSMRYRYDNKMADGTVTINGNGADVFGHAPDTTVRYHHWSPKLGATYAITNHLSGFVAYNHAFRVPSESQLFRPSGGTAGTAQTNALSAIQLKPVKVNNFEVGLKGRGDNRLSWELSVFDMKKRDDIVSYQDPTGAKLTQNAGRTRHRGIEIGAGIDVASAWRIEGSVSHTKHRYEEWIVSSTVDYNGKNMEEAPQRLANLRTQWRPAFLNGGRVEIEAVKIGEYWLDAANTARYDGHNLINLRASAFVSKDVEVFANLNNATDRRYAESASISGTTPAYAPGLPRALYVGVQAKW